jgi:hypothetical protein
VPPPPPEPPPPPPAKGLEPAAVKPVIVALRARYHACYDAGLARDPGLKGTLALDLTIAPAGTVTSVGAGEASTLTDAGVTGCIAEATKAAVFPQAEGKTTIVLPLAFEPGAPAEVSKGGLDAAEIHKALRGASDKVRVCFETALKTTPTLGGTVKVKFSVTTKGSLIDVSALKDSTLKDKDLHKCVLEVVKGVSFPKPKKKTDVVYPFELKAPD